VRKRGVSCDTHIIPFDQRKKVVLSGGDRQVVIVVHPSVKPAAYRFP
jgi:hypothetical protein